MNLELEKEEKRKKHKIKEIKMKRGFDGIQIGTTTKKEMFQKIFFFFYIYV